MRETRRSFVSRLSTAAGFGAFSIPLLTLQRAITPPPPPAPAEAGAPTTLPPNVHTIDPAKRDLLLKNERQFRAGIEQLYQLTSELRNEVEKTTTTEVLSVRMYKKTEAIEKLAKELKRKVKGVE